MLARSVLLVWLASCACDGRVKASPDAGPTEPSPNASILPAPLATGLEQAPPGPRDASAVDADADAEPVVAEWQREDRALPEDLWAPHEVSGLVLGARFRWPDVTAPPRLPEANADALGRVAEQTRFELSIELAAAGRLRLVLVSKGFSLPLGTELRGRAETMGHLLLWPNRALYAVLQPGTLRAVLNERRADAEPLTRAKSVPSGEGLAFGYATVKNRFTTSFGRLDLEQALVAGSDAGGPLLCRVLLEIAGIHPEAPACAGGHVPVRADYTWSNGGRLTFEVGSIQRGTTLPTESFTFPPSGAEHRIGELPESPAALLVERTELRALRNKAVLSAEGREAGAPKEGLLVVNGGDLATYVLVDGAPVAYLRPRHGDVMLDLVSGSYSVQARDFLATAITPAAVLAVPARFVVGEAPKAEP